VTRVALVGLGAISFEHLEKLGGIPDTEVVGVCDLSATVAVAVAERFGVGPAFTSYSEMLAATRPDAVHVLTPPQSHAPLVREALEAGAHVLVEKPIAPTWEEYAELRDLAAARGRMLCENYTYRFAPVFLRALSAVRDGALGEVISVEVSYNGVIAGSQAYRDARVVHFAHALPGGALQNFVSHPVSVALAFIDRVESISVWRRRLEPELASDDELRALLAGQRTCATIAVSGHSQPPSFLVRVSGTGATLDVDVLGERVHRRVGSSALGETTRRGFGDLAAAGSWTARTLVGRRDPYFSGLRILLERFYAALRDSGPPPVALAEMDAVNSIVRDIFANGNGR
jgi:predicted dehydrogenase